MAKSPAEIIYQGDSVYHLDEKDRKILAVLALNSRTPTSVIGKLAQLSQENVFYRLRKLKEREIIVDYFTAFDLRKLGILTFIVFVKFRKIKKDEEQTLIEELLRNPNVSWLTSTAGQFDLILFLQAPTIYEFEDYWAIISTQFGQYFKDISIGTLTELRHCHPLYPVIEKSAFIEKIKTENLPYSKLMEKNSSKISIDKKDLQIMFQLQANSRIKLTEMAKKCKISAQNVDYRIKNLVSSGIVSGFYYRPNYHKFGFQYYTLRIKLNNHTAEKANKLTNFIRQQFNTFVYLRMIGQWDFSVHLFFLDSRELNNFLLVLREHFGEIIETIDTTIHLDQFMYVYFSKNTVKYLQEKYP